VRSKVELATLLRRRPRAEFLKACETIERRYTEKCGTANELCAKFDCSSGEKICLVPVLQAGREYRRACAAAWSRLFALRTNRVPGWRTAVAAWRVR
jgi:hypothetical protein